MSALANRIGFEIEANYPALIGAISAPTFAYYGPSLFGYMLEEGWKIDSIYSSVFDVASLFTAMLFAFYSFIVVTESGFIARARSSHYFKMTLQYTIRAILLGAILTMTSVPMMVIEPKPTGYDMGSLYAVALWVGLAGWTFAAFVRAVHLFSIFAAKHH